MHLTPVSADLLPLPSAFQAKDKEMQGADSTNETYRRPKVAWFGGPIQPQLLGKRAVCGGTSIQVRSFGRRRPKIM